MRAIRLLGLMLLLALVPACGNSITGPTPDLLPPIANFDEEPPCDPEEDDDCTARGGYLGSGS